MPMKMRWSRVLLWLGLILAGVLVLHLANLRSTRKPPAVNAPWIGLAKHGMDAGDPNIRQALIWSLGADRDSSYQPLAERCGIYEENESHEIYIFTREAVLLPDHFESKLRREYEVLGDAVKVSEWEEKMHLPEPVIGNAPAPEAPPDFQDAFPEHRVTTVAKTELSKLATAWKSSLAWNSRQDTVYCYHMGGVQLEACVDGKYSVRNTRCNVELREDTEKLLKAFQPGDTGKARH